MKLAAFDVGTNTVLMLVVEIDGMARPRPLLECSRITRLGSGVDQASARLDPGSATLTLATIEEFAARGRALGAERFVAAATASLRDAADGRRIYRARAARAPASSSKPSAGSRKPSLSHLAVTCGLRSIQRSRC